MTRSGSAVAVRPVSASEVWASGAGLSSSTAGMASEAAASLVPPGTELGMTKAAAQAGVCTRSSAAAIFIAAILSIWRELDQFFPAAAAELRAGGHVGLARRALGG